MDKRLAPGHKANRAVEAWGLWPGVDHPQDSLKAHHVAHHGSSQVVPTEHLDPTLQEGTLILPIFNAPSLTRINGRTYSV